MSDAAGNGARSVPPVTRPTPRVPQAIRRRFRRGRERPRGVAWFGIGSFWGHMQHFIASAIATEDVDSRDWMTPDEPYTLAERVARLLGGTASGATVTERLRRDIWVDYVADTGDDVSVSRAVAELVFSAYELPDPAREGGHLTAPRGDVLLFGGDTAYPVATADEIRDRVVVPWNRVLVERDDGRRRVLLGIPGNHDWYDGLDGFGRLFRRHVDFGPDGGARPTLHGSRRTMLGHYAEWAREFVRGGQVEKPRTLALAGYTAAQGASYFALPVAPGISMLAVDRQLKAIDTRQREFFASYLDRNVGTAPWVILPDPVFAFGQPSPTGGESIRALRLTLSARPHLVLSGDIHHYRRDVDGPTVHVTAGGGGAFLHPAQIARRDGRIAVTEWPGPAQSRALLLQVPWKIALGSSGVLPHLAALAVFSPILLRTDSAPPGVVGIAFLMVLFTLLFAAIGGARRNRAVLLPALATSALLGGACFGLRVLVVGFLHGELGALASRYAAGSVAVAASGLSLLVASIVGAFVFGAYLSALTLFGHENTQAFTALDHPGFKHFVRLRIRADGSAIDGWCLGLVDPLRDGETPVLVDSFTWRCR